jgi:AraC-like DNA-binding protein
VDVLSDLLHRAHVRDAVVRQSILCSPWSIHLADPEPLTAVATLKGGAAITFREGTTRKAARPSASFLLEAGDIALVKGGDYVIADDPSTPCQMIVRAGRKQMIGGGEGAASAERMSAPRTFGDRKPGATTLLHGIYTLHGSVGDWRGTTRVSGLHTWLGAITDPAIGEALAMLHANPQQRWTTAALAHKVGMSRAAFSARFNSLAGVPPISYLTGWRMTLAADMLRDTNATVAAVAHEVGYENVFAFSTAFKRARGYSPSAWRRADGGPSRENTFS